MKYFTYALMAAISFAASAQAADKSTDVDSSQYAVQSIICQQSLIHTPSADVAYQPGVDVNGNPVATADLNPTPQVSSSSYTEVPLTVNLANKLGLSRPAEAQAVVGSLKIYKDGRVLFNDQDISQQASALCGGKPVPAMAVPPANAMPETPPAPAARRVDIMNQPEVPMPGSAAPSATTAQ